MEAQNFTEIVDIEPLHVAAHIEMLGRRLAKPSVKQHLAAIPMLFDLVGRGPGHRNESRGPSGARSTQSGKERRRYWRKRKRASSCILLDFLNASTVDRRQLELPVGRSN